MTDHVDVDLLGLEGLSELERLALHYAREAERHAARSRRLSFWAIGAAAASVLVQVGLLVMVP